MVETACSPGKDYESDSSIESVDLKQVAKEVKEAACDPMEKTKVQNVESQTIKAPKTVGKEIAT